MKNYKKNLRTSFIICGIMFVIILLIFVLSSYVNKNVAENMTGKLLFINESETGSKVHVYDFDNKRTSEIQGLENIGDISGAQFGKDGSICAAVFTIKCTQFQRVTAHNQVCHDIPIFTCLIIIYIFIICFI